jgi:protein SCO1/2
VIARAAPRSRRLLGVLAVAALAAATPARAQNAAQVRRELQSLAVDERLGAAAPRDAAFEDEEGRRVTLAELAGRPVLLSFNYVACLRLCGVQLAGIARALHDLEWKGDGFTLFTVSIDPAEQRAASRRSKEEVVRQVAGGDGVARAWRFVRGRPEDVEALARAVGFRYRPDPATGQIAHPATLVVLTGDGRVSGYLHGIRPEAAALRAAVDRATADRVATASEQASLGGFLLMCVGLDPSDPTPRALKVMRAAGTLSVGIALLIVGVQALRGSRTRREQSS